MRFIHTADIHLDSCLRSNFNREMAKERNHEILTTFINMVNYAVRNGIGYILICGDLFDSDYVSGLTLNTIRNLITGNPDINFYYLRGNHDNADFSISGTPDNLFLFEADWKCYRVNNCAVWGIEPNGSNSELIQTSFLPDRDLINIVMLHGQEAFSRTLEGAETININSFRNKGINYLALGHVHEHKLKPLDNDISFYCYPGCLEGRGFDETGLHGFMDVTIDEETGRVIPEFVPFARRTLFEIKVDVTGIESTVEIINKARESLNNIDILDKDLLKITLVGNTAVNSEIDELFIEKSFENNFYFVKVKNDTRLLLESDDYLYDESLKGVFIRTLLDADLDDDTREAVMKLGINALRGGIEL